MEKSVAIVTGSYKGLGVECVKVLAKNIKDGVVVMTARNAEAGEKSLAVLKKEGISNVVFEQLDICDEKSVDKFIEEITKKYKKIDVLVNNAASLDTKDKLATMYTGLPYDHSIDLYSQAKTVFGTNYYATKNFTEKCMKVMSETARVVTVNSELIAQSLYVERFYEVFVRPRILNKEITEELVDSMVKDFLEECKKGSKHMEEEGISFSTYAISKVFLHYLTKVWAKVGSGRVFVSVDPGWCQTDLGTMAAAKKASHGGEDIAFCAMEDNFDIFNPVKGWEKYQKTYKKEYLQGKFVMEGRPVGFI